MSNEQWGRCAESCFANLLKITPYLFYFCEMYCIIESIDEKLYKCTGIIVNIKPMKETETFI